VQSPNGLSRCLAIEETKEHGTGRSYFFGGLRREDIPIGSGISWEDDPQLWRHAEEAEPQSAKRS